MTRNSVRCETTAEIKVPFHDVDMLGVVWHGHYLRYFEVARCQLFDAIEYSYQQMRDSGYAWPVIDARLRFPQPARFGQVLLVRCWVAEWENRLKVDYEIRDKNSGQRLTKGYTVQVAVDLNTQEMCFESPPILMQKLGIA